MSGTQIFILALILLLGLLILLMFSMRSKTPAAAEFSIENVFSFKFSISPVEKNGVADAAAAAATARGQSGDKAADEVRSRLSTVEHLRLRRILWVDDHPDNNVYEALALMRLGFVITTATSNDAARHFINEVDFDLVVTDIGRDGEQEGGAELINELHAKAPAFPVIVYTMGADRRRDELVAQGASAVEDTPSALLSAVLASVT